MGRSGPDFLRLHFLGGKMLGISSYNLFEPFGKRDEAIKILVIFISFGTNKAQQNKCMCFSPIMQVFKQITMHLGCHIDPCQPGIYLLLQTKEVTWPPYIKSHLLDIHQFRHKLLHNKYVTKHFPSA